MDKIRAIKGTYDILPGMMDEFRVWERALSESEMSEIATTCVPADETDLRAYWSFDEESGGIVPDLTGNGYDLELVGATLEEPSDVSLTERECSP